jgi:hypothetical protein
MLCSSEMRQAQYGLTGCQLGHGVEARRREDFGLRDMDNRGAVVNPTVYPKAATLCREVETARAVLRRVPTVENERRVDEAWCAYAAYIGLPCTVPSRRKHRVRVIGGCAAGSTP